MKKLNRMENTCYLCGSYTCSVHFKGGYVCEECLEYIKEKV